MHCRRRRARRSVERGGIVNIKAFFVDAITSALALKIGTPEDVIRHVTPDVLSVHLPRPLWARVLTACLGAPRVDARLLVETIGIANLCEHIPSTIIWGCIADMGARSLGKTVAEVAVAVPTRVQTTASGRAIIAPPPDPTAPLASGTGVPGMPGAVTAAPPAHGPNIPSPKGSEPLSDVLEELEQTEQPVRPRTSTNRFRQSNTTTGRTLGSSRRPQVAATPPQPVAPNAFSGRSKRTSTDLDSEPQTNVGSQWGDREIAVDDSQLVDWQTDVGASSAITGDDDFSDLGNRKR
jgi:hypothetical protein